MVCGPFGVRISTSRIFLGARVLTNQTGERRFTISSTCGRRSRELRDSGEGAQT
jgi:hypothetical protein